MKSLSCVQLLVTPWTTAHQAPLSMGFSRQEYWSGVPLPSPEMSVSFYQMQPELSAPEELYSQALVHRAPSEEECQPVLYGLPRWHHW